MITCSLTNGTLILITDDGKVITARNDHPRWNDIIGAFKVGNETLLRSFLSLQEVLEEYTVGMLSVNQTGVTYNNIPIHTIDSERVMAFLRDGLPYKPIANYIARKAKNPSARAIAEMYNFLEHRGMPLTSDGKFIAYKGVQTDFFSIRGNKETVILRGTVNAAGQILNNIGAVIEVERSSVDDNFRSGCSFGLHAGSLEYARGWGQRVVLVEIDPADVVSVPEDCNCQKLRCCKYIVIGEYTGPMSDTLTTEFDDSPSDGNEDFDHEDEDDVAEPPAVPDAITNQDIASPNVDATVPNDEDADNSPDESWIREKATTEEKCNVSAGGLLGVTNVHSSEDTDCIDYNNPTYIKVRAIIADHFAINEADIRLGDKINSVVLGTDSFEGVELAMVLEEEFGIELPDKFMEDAISPTISDICKYIDDRLLQERARYAKVKDPSAVPDSYCTTGKIDGMTAVLDFYYATGEIDGMTAATNSLPAAWQVGDDLGADSRFHAQYIKGYIAGYIK